MATLTGLIRTFEYTQARYTAGLCSEVTYRTHLVSLVGQAQTAGLFWAFVAALQKRGATLAA